MQRSLAVTGQNIANINTVGYTRRTLDLAERVPTTPQSPGRGVDVVGIRAARDNYVQARMGREGAGLEKDAAILDGVGVISAMTTYTLDRSGGTLSPFERGILLSGDSIGLGNDPVLSVRRLLRSQT